MPVVTLLDTLGIPAFVFATDRLRDAVGGAALVERLAAWAGAVAPAPDVLVAGGGRALLRFADEARARSALARLSRRAHQEAPGLEFVATHVPYQPGGLAAAVRPGQRDLSRDQRERLPAVPLLGPGATASRETPPPATALASDGQPIAATLAAQRQPGWADRDNDLLPPDSGNFRRGEGPARRLQFPLDVDYLGRGDQRLLGVVHIDGLGVGRKVTDWVQQQAAVPRDDE